MEIKKTHNGKFWNGLESQLPSYMKSDEVTNGWFVGVRYREGRVHDDRVSELGNRVKAVGEKKGINLFLDCD